MRPPAVHVGIDYYMSRAEAQEYIDDPGDPFTVWIRGYDNGSNEFLFALPMTVIGASDDYGLSADFDLTVPGGWLNEDSGTDEIIAVLTLTDTDTNTVTKTVTKTFTTPVLSGLLASAFPWMFAHWKHGAMPTGSTVGAV